LKPSTLNPLGVEIIELPMCVENLWRAIGTAPRRT
jgi:hypothetical protein